MKIKEKFQELNEKDEGAYMPHIYYGDPHEEFSLEQIKAVAENGADLIELGIPFSDPIADGPTFQAACERALEKGITPKKCIQGIRKLRDDGLKIPIIVTTYYNIPYVFGVGKFLKELRKVKAQEIIVPDLPIEEAETLLEAGQKNDINVILQVTPSTSRERLRKIVDSTSGFLYVVNVKGVTGVRDSVIESAVNLISMVKEYTDISLMTGFGISKKEEAKAIVSAGADGVITGSALAAIYGKNLENPEKTLVDIGKFTRQMKEGCIEGYRKRLKNRRIYKDGKEHNIYTRNDLS